MKVKTCLICLSTVAETLKLWAINSFGISRCYRYSKFNKTKSGTQVLLSDS